jgi:hypothetical protein
MSRRILSLCFLVSVLAAKPGAAGAAPWEAKDLNPVTVREAPKQEPVLIVSNGAPAAVIAVPGPKSRPMAEAAKRLQFFIEKTSGAKLAITNRVPEGPALVLGACPEAAQAGLKPDAMPAEGFAIKTVGNKVFITGNTNSPINGAIWGSFEFAERVLGVRWFLPIPQTNGDDFGICVIPASTLAVPPLWIEDAPYFRKRVIWPDSNDPWRGAGLQMGPLHQFLRAGNSWPVDLKVHSPNWSKTAYTNTAPEVFQLKADGTRDFSVLCYSSPKTLEAYLEQIQNFVDKKKFFLGIMNGQAITVSPADVELSCTCPDCKAMWNKDGGSQGTASRIMVRFVANLAQAVKTRWPDRPFTIIFLPYLNYTTCPEGARFPDNVEVQICGMPGMASYKEPSVLAADQRNIDSWMAASGRKIQNWEYDVWPAHKTKAAFLYPHVVQRFYLANRDKTVGTFINGEFNHWPRQTVSLYAWMKCLWNPDFPVDAAIDSFCERLFGPAAAAMRELVGLQMKGWEDSRWPDGRFSPKAIYEISFPRETVKHMEALYARAREEAKADPLIMARLDYLKEDLEAFFKESRDFAEGTGFKPLLLQKVGEAPVLDGKLDEPNWERALPVSFVKATGKDKGAPAQYPTVLSGLWTPEGIYLGFRMSEPFMDLLETRHGGHDNGEMWWDDNVELFLDPSGQSAGDFHQIIINAAGNTLDNHNKDLTWEATTMKTGVFKGPDFWSLEVFLPFALFPNARLPTPGAASSSFWTGNFTRHRVGDRSNIAGGPPKREGSVREYQRMNTTGSITSDNLSDFAEIRFSE